MTPQLTIKPYDDIDQDAVIALILSIQNEEFHLGLSLQEQDDLLEIPQFYQAKGEGGFWCAHAKGVLVGTIALKRFDPQNAALRKLFVAKPYRGAPVMAGQKLLDHAFDQAKIMDFGGIWLGTIETLLAAHRFYEKNGFAKVDQTQLPMAFPIMKPDTCFYHRALPSIGP